MKKGHDVRAIANLVLDHCEAKGLPVTNLQINKIIYFMHVDWIAEFGQPLVSAKIEAWQYGPVFREVFNQFKVYGRNEIEGRAKKVDYDTGLKIDAKSSLDPESERFARSLVDFYSGMPAGLLVDLSHVKGGAWDVVWHHSGEFNVGMEITNDIIVECQISKRQKVKEN